METKNISLSELLGNLQFNLENIEFNSDDGQTLSYNFDVNSFQFLKYSEKDLIQNDSHGYINSLTNAKRAIDCQIDSVLGCFGLLGRQNFPTKISYLQKMGIVTPRIVNKVIKARNLLEHEFVIPEREQVEDALDISLLFALVLDQKLKVVWTIVGIESTDPENSEDKEFPYKNLNIKFFPDEKKFELKGFFANIADYDFSKPREIKELGKVIISPKAPGFFELINLIINIDSKYNLTDGYNDPDDENYRKIRLFIESYSKK